MESIGPDLQEANAPLWFDEKDRIKTLGLSWHPAIDEFRFEVNLKHCPTTFTKRNVLSIIASIFDPLGLLGPAIIPAKILMQELRKARLGWMSHWCLTIGILERNLPRTSTVERHAGRKNDSRTGENKIY